MRLPTFASDAVKRVFELWRVDPAWSIGQRDGFRWWPHYIARGTARCGRKLATPLQLRAPAP